jgi:3-deoxy-D-manno-octulosonic-acid transferase
MFFIYQVLIILIIIFSPIILLIRFIKKKEHKTRFVEKFCLFSRKRNKGNLIWIHAASVGELMSVIPLIDKLEKNKDIKTILVTTSTLSSSKIFNNYKFNKTIHQFFPIDFFYFSKKFIDYWNPKIAIFIDSEIWPSMYKEIKKNSVPLLLMNARITKKSFQRWKFFNKFTQNIFNSIKIAYPSNSETYTYLKKLNIKKIKSIGNLKFTETVKQKSINFQSSFLLSINKRLIWCASSTHPSEEKIIAKTHLVLKKKFNNLLTIIIPRHIRRINEINQEINSMGLKTIIRTTNQKINHGTDIYLVDTYGETKKFFNISKIAFIGGSLVDHGGQNPIEPARFNLNIIHGPNINNFKDIYDLFNKKRIAHKIKNFNQLKDITHKLLNIKKKKKINLEKIGNIILQKSIKEVVSTFNDEIKKT